MATYDPNLGMWRANTGGYFGSEQEAAADDAAAAGGGQTSTDQDFSRGAGTGGIWSMAPTPVSAGPDPGDQPNPANPGGMSDNERERRIRLNDRRKANTIAVNNNRDLSGSSTTGAVGAGQSVSDLMLPQNQVRSGGSGSYTLDSNGNRVYIRGDNYAGESQGITDQMGTVTSHGMVGGTEMLTWEPPASSGPATGNREDAAAQRTDEAGAVFGDEDAENQLENEEAVDDWGAAIAAIEGGDYGLSDEARGYQREGLAQQRLLLERMLGFDPNQYATKFADQALARQIALGRSQGGGYAAQQGGMFAAMEQAPALYAEGARQASALENQRLTMAESAAKAFGDLGTMTRGQDESRAQFESDLTVEIAKQVGALSQGTINMNQRESEMFAEIWMNFADLQSRSAGMDSDEQIAWWQREMTKRGQDKQFDAIIASLKADGAVTSKDLIGGLFQLGGGLVSTVGMMGAA